MNISPFLRQVLVLTSSQLAATSMGGSIGYPCVLLHQFQSNESSIRPDLDTTTWIVSSFGTAGIFSIFMPPLMQLKGRKFAFIISCLILAIGWSLNYAAMNATALIISEAFSGLGGNCIIIVNLMTVSEILAPKYRAASMMLLGVNQAVGMSGTTVLGNFVYSKTISLIMCCPVVAALLMGLTWPESPSWLAYKGNFDECEKAFIRLRGTDDEAMKELQQMIAAQKENRRIAPKSTMKDILGKFGKKDFNLPHFYMLLILCNFFLSGATGLYIYTQQILEQGTGNEAAAFYGYLYRDVVLVLGSCVAFTLVRYFKSKSVLLTCTFGCAFSNICSFTVTYLQSVDILSKDSLLLIYSFSLFVTFSKCGFNFITFALATELMPVKHRGVGGGLFIVYSCSLHSLSAKLFPYIAASLNLWGTFLLFAINGVITGILVWRYIPDTKNRTLQEIEDYYNYGSFVRHDAVDDVHVSLNDVKKKDCK